MDELTEEEQAVCNLAVEHFQQKGVHARVTFIACHGFGAHICAYFLMLHIINSDGRVYTSEHLLYLRIHDGFVLIPEKESKIVNASSQVEIPDFSEIIRLLRELKEWPESSNLD